MIDTSIEEAPGSVPVTEGIRELTSDELALISGGGFWDKVAGAVIGYAVSNAIPYLWQHKGELAAAPGKYNGIAGHNPSPY